MLELFLNYALQKESCTNLEPILVLIGNLVLFNTEISSNLESFFYNDAWIMLELCLNYNFENLQDNLRDNLYVENNYRKKTSCGKKLSA